MENTETIDKEGVREWGGGGTAAWRRAEMRGKLKTGGN